MSKSDEKLKKIKKILKTYKLLTNLQKITIFFNIRNKKNTRVHQTKENFFKQKLPNRKINNIKNRLVKQFTRLSQQVFKLKIPTLFQEKECTK